MNKLKQFILNNKTILLCGTILIVIITAISIFSYEKERKETVFATFAKIDDREITALEYSYHYNLYLSDFIEEYGSSASEFGLDLSKPYESQELSDGTTWAEYFRNKTIENILEINFMYEEAEKNNFICENIDEEVNKYLEDIRYSANLKDLSYKKYLSNTFIKNTKEKDLIPIIKKYVIASEYIQNYKDNYEVSEEQINKYYEENKDTYDEVDYRIFKFSVYDEYLNMAKESSNTSTVVKNEEETDEEANLVIDVDIYEEAKEKTLKTATEFFNQVYDEETFKELCIKYTKNDEVKEKYKEFDLSLNEGKTYSSVSKSLAKWLFNEERQEKSTAVIYDDNELCYYVVYFKDRYKSTTNTVTIKSIFVPYILTDFNSFEFSTADKDKTEETVKEILDKWEKSEKKESDFDQLLKEYNKTNTTGIYEDSLYTSIPSIFKDWAYDEERAAGDVEVFRSDSGCSIAYYVSSGENKINQTIRHDYIEEQYTNLLKELLSTHKVSIN